MGEKTIDVPLTKSQLEFMIRRIHSDNPFRKYLEEKLESIKQK